MNGNQPHALVLLGLACAACQQTAVEGPDDPNELTTPPVPAATHLFAPPFDPNQFVAAVDNPFFPLTPGTVFAYEAETDEGTELGEVFVTFDTKNILGVTATVVRDRVYLDENENGVLEGDAPECELIEETFDWYAQDGEGNVWYLGEDSKEYEDCAVASTEGSWEAGMDDAEAGIIMPAEPRIGIRYRQELALDVAEDMAVVLSLKKSVSVEYGDFDDCLQTMDYTPLEPGAREFKFYCSGVGLVLEISPAGGRSRNELVDIH